MSFDNQILQNKINSLSEKIKKLSAQIIIAGKGEKGDDGYTPKKGVDYFDGAKGVKGDKGDTGAQGLQGIQGLKGDKGDTGLQGPKGDTGDVGPQGQQGPQGERGLQGEQGLKGNTGLQGDAGPQGLQGPQGIAGTQGMTGPQGERGLQGLQGEQGPQGVQGLKGDTGLQGPKGDKGDTGSQGLQGNPGSDAQVTKSNVEAVLTGVITSHSHNYEPIGFVNLANDTLAQALATNINTRITVTANRTLTTTVPAAGIRCSVMVLTSGTSSFTITFGTGFKPVGTLATGTTTGRVFIINFISNGTNLYETGRTAAMVA